MNILLLLCTIIAAARAQSPLAKFSKLQRTVLPWAAPLSTVASRDPAVLAAACLSFNGTPSSSPPNCTWSPALPNKYLPGCAAPPDPPGARGATASVNCINYPTLGQAQAACAADAHCAGVTSQNGGVPPWELRRDPPTASPLGEISYAITNAAACHAGGAPRCNAFTTDGKLFHCPFESCDCDSGAAWCARGRDIFTGAPPEGLNASTTDLFVAAGLPPPPEWAAAVAAGSMLFAQPEPYACYMPE